MIYLMDIGTHFDILYKKQRVTIHYGEYALALANINYEKVQDTIKIYIDTFTKQFEIATTLGYIKHTHPDSVAKYKEHGIYPNAVKKEVIQTINRTLYNPLYKLLDNSYLNKKQLDMITRLMLSELENNIEADTFNWQEESTYIPSVIIHMGLREQLEGILLKDNNYFSEEIQQRLSQKLISSSINIDKSGTTRTVFHVKDTIAFLMIDLQKYLTSTKAVIRCENPDCNRLFYPKSNKNKHYCRLKHNGSKLTCEEIMHRKPTDEFAKRAKRARGAQQGFVKNALSHENNPKFQYDYGLLDKTYQQWQVDCTLQMELFRKSNDVDGFIDWIRNTRFTAERLGQLGIRTVMKKRK